MPKRVFRIIDGKFTEVTPEGERKVCDQISKGVKPFHEPLDFKVPKRRKASLWPRELDGAGVNPDQVDEAMRIAKEKGVPTEYNRVTGCPIFRDQNHEKRFCKTFGYYNRNAGYGDAAPDNYVESTHSEKVLRQKWREYRQDIKDQIASLERELGIRS